MNYIDNRFEVWFCSKFVYSANNILILELSVIFCFFYYGLIDSLKYINI